MCPWYRRNVRETCSRQHVPEEHQSCQSASEVVRCPRAGISAVSTNLAITFICLRSSSYLISLGIKKKPFATQLDQSEPSANRKPRACLVYTAVNVMRSRHDTRCVRCGVATRFTFRPLSADTSCWCLVFESPSLCLLPLFPPSCSAWGHVRARVLYCCVYSSTLLLCLQQYLDTVV